MSKVDLYGLHEDLAQYFETVLHLNKVVTQSLKVKFSEGDINIKEYIDIMDRCMLPPPLLTSISSFLRNNDVRVSPDSLLEEVSEYEAQLNQVNVTKLEHLDPTAE